MTTYRTPKAQSRAQLDPNKDREYTDWSKLPKASYKDLEHMVQVAKSELLTLQELRNELKQTKTELQNQEYKNQKLSQELQNATRELNLLKNTGASKDMLLSAAMAFPKSKVEIIEVKRSKKCL